MPAELATGPAAVPVGRPHLRALDGIRGIAVAAVVVHHLQLPGLGGLYIGVDVFFALSGFLITSSLLRDGASLKLRSFWARRAWRVGPAAAVLLGWYVLVSLRDPERTLRMHFALVAALQFINVDMADGPPPMSTSPHLGHLWSLAAEIQFYVLWPIVVAALLRLRRPAEAVVVTAALVAGGSALLRYGLAEGGSSWGRLYFGPDVRSTALFTGATAAGLLAIRQRRRPEPLIGRPSPAWLLVLPAMYTLGWYGLEGSLTWRPGLTWGLTLVSVSAGVVVFHGAAAGSSPLNRLLAWRPLVFLGTISYSLYLWHVPVVALVVHRWPDIGDAQKALVVVVVSLVLATLSYRWVERPLMSRRSRNAIRRRRRGDPAAVGTAGPGRP